MIRINLLSEGRRPVVARRAKAAFSLGDQDPSMMILIIGLILGGLVGGGLWYHKRSQIKAVDQRIARARAEVKELEEIIRQVEAFEARKQELESKIAVIQDLKRRQKGPVMIMDSISRSLSELLWLDSLRLSSNSVRLRGQAFNTNAIASFIGSLNDVPEFREPNTKDIVKVRGNRDLYNFDLIFNFAYALPPSPEEDGEADETEGVAAR